MRDRLHIYIAVLVIWMITFCVGLPTFIWRIKLAQSQGDMMMAALRFFPYIIGITLITGAILINKLRK